MRIQKIIGMALVFGLLTHAAVHAQQTDMQDEEQTDNSGTPPRLSFVDGQVSFWRTGAPDWTEAEINTPLTPGDQLYSGESANLELQIDERAFVRAGANTQIGLDNIESNYTQFRVTAGYVSLDIRNIDPGKTVEVDAPNAAFIIDHAGYYRVDVDGDRTSFTVRRSGEATVTPADGDSFQILSDEEVTLDGITDPQVGSYEASELDQWDRWGLSRTDRLRNSISSRYVSPGVYGVSDLDEAGEWQDVPEYGAVWIPTDVPDGWAPYSSGSWIDDPVYGTTWVDTAPWGWAPYHYGRWVSLDGQWAWAPGPPVRRPAYAPALVAFLGNTNSVERGDEGPVIAWVPLGWGEPLIPWWGPERFHRPWWGGWGGPRVREVEHTGRYRNMALSNGIMMVHEKHFGQGPVKSIHSGGLHLGLRPMQADSFIAKIHGNVLPAGKRGIKPPDAFMKRSVVATRPPRSIKGLTSQGEGARGPAGHALPAPRIVQSAGKIKPDSNRHRAPQGADKVQRPGVAGRVIPPLPSGTQQTVHTPGNRTDSNELQQRHQIKAPPPPDRASQPPPPLFHKGETGSQGESSRIGHEPAASQPQQRIRMQQQPDVPSSRSIQREPSEAGHGPAASQPQQRMRTQQQQQVQPVNQVVNKPERAGRPQPDREKKVHKHGEKSPENGQPTN